jgi:phosphatidate cytidylyltransferase
MAELSDVTTGPEPADADRPEIVDGREQRVNRAGRNLPVATIYHLPVGFVVLVGVVLEVAVLELSFALRRSASAGVVPTVPLLLGTAAMVVAAYTGGIEALAVAFAATVLVIQFWRLPQPLQGSVRDLGAGVWVAVYPAFLGSFAVLLFAQTHGADRIVVYIGTVVCSDVGGYAVGVLLGRHAMAPSISPKKSWEGLAGSVVLCTLGGWILSGWLLHTPWWQGVLLGLAVVCVATLGDLLESMIKRDLGIKDLGRLLPGHGGVMDRLDSLAPVAPVVYILLTLFVGS